jgi:hypothetical protein
MKMRYLFVSIVLTALVGCSQGKPGTRIKNKGLPRPGQAAPEITKHEDLPAEGESVTKLDSGYEIRGPAIQPDNPSVIKLKSGKEIKVRGAGKVFFTQAKPGWMIKYETNLNIDDVPALQKEAEEIWPLLEKDVEKGGYDSAILSANETPKKTSVGPFSLSNNRGYNFAFEKTKSGRWEMTNKKSKNKSEKP